MNQHDDGNQLPGKDDSAMPSPIPADTCPHCVHGTSGDGDQALPSSVPGQMQSTVDLPPVSTEPTEVMLSAALGWSQETLGRVLLGGLIASGVSLVWFGWTAVPWIVLVAVLLLGVGYGITAKKNTSNIEARHANQFGMGVCVVIALVAWHFTSSRTETPANSQLNANRPTPATANTNTGGEAPANPFDPFKGVAMPEAIRTLIDKGDRELRQGDFDAAIASFSQAIQTVPEDHRLVLATLHAMRATCHLKKGAKDEALAEYDTAIRSGCTAGLAFHNRGRILAEKGNYQGAVADFNRAIELDSSQAKTYHYRGLVYEKLGMRETADQDFAKAKTLDPDVEKTSHLHMDAPPH